MSITPEPTYEAPPREQQIADLWLQLEVIDDDIARHERIADDLTSCGCWRDAAKIREDIRALKVERDGVCTAIDELEIEELVAPEQIENHVWDYQDQEWGDPLQEFADRRLALAQAAATQQVVAMEMRA